MRYLYRRVSTPKQKLERQLTNAVRVYPEFADHPERIFSDKCTGTKVDRPDWNRLHKLVISHAENEDYKETDCIVFDEVSRMARNAKEGFALYKELFLKGIDLEFLKETHINTESYRRAMQGIIDINVNTGDEATDEMLNTITKAVNKFMLRKVEQDIYKAFEQAEHEVQLLHQRISEGLRDAKANGKQVGRVQDAKIETWKAKEAKQIILKHSRAFGGTLNDADTRKLAGVCKTSYYKYKQELKAEQNNRTNKKEAS